MTFCFWTVSGLDVWTVCYVFHLKTFAVALAVQDVFQLKMSGFSVCTFSHFTVLVKASEKGTDVQNGGHLFYVCRQLLFYVC